MNRFLARLAGAGGELFGHPAPVRTHDTSPCAKSHNTRNMQGLGVWRGPQVECFRAEVDTGEHVTFVGLSGVWMCVCMYECMHTCVWWWVDRAEVGAGD